MRASLLRVERDSGDKSYESSKNRERSFVQTYWVNFQVGEFESPSTIFAMGWV